MTKTAPDPASLSRIFDLRWMARTDLLWLCRNVLDYNLVNEKVHGPVIRHLQQFEMPTIEIARASDQVLRSGGFRYTPWCDPYVELKGNRRRLTCDSRGYFKCLRLNTVLSTAYGTYVQARDLKIGERLKSLSLDYTLTTCTVTGIELQAPQPCFKVTFSSGRVLEVSEEHPFRGLGVWIYAKTLRPGNRIALLTSPDLSWDTVKAVEYIGEEETLAIETSDGVLVVDDIVTHNTSVCTIAHAIQWFLNYPHIAMGLFFASDGKAQDVLKNGIKRHFQTNSKLRELFPDYCPQTRINDWGTAEEFTLPNRDGVLQRLKLPPRVEPSIKSLSLDKSKAGYHFDIIKCSDLVDETNCLTPSQRASVNNHFGLMPKLLVRRYDGRDGWIDVEGTFYHPQDLHGIMVDEWRKKPDKRRWQVFVRGVFQRDLKKCGSVGITPRTTAKYDPDEMYLPFTLDDRGKRMPTWPEADTIEKLELEEQDYSEGGAVFAGQRALDFAADTTSSRPFATGCIWKDAEDYARVPIAYRVITVDLADTVGIKSNPSVITVAGFDRNGRCYVESIQRGKWDANNAVKKIFDTYERTRLCRLLSIEDYAYVHGLKPSLERESAVRGIIPPFHYEKRDRSPNGKIKRIVQALSPPFNNSELIFIDPLALDPVEAKATRQALESELRDCTIFSTGDTDDILDTLADIFITRRWAGTNSETPQDARIAALLQERQRQAAYTALIYPPELEATAPTYNTGW